MPIFSRRPVYLHSFMHKNHCIAMHLFFAEFSDTVTVASCHSVFDDIRLYIII